MNWFTKLFAPQKGKFCSGDNIGTIFTDVKEADVAWTADGMSFGKDQRANVTLAAKDGGMNMEIKGKGHPFLCHEFSAEDEAKQAFEALPFVEVAADTGEYISTRVLNLGVYRNNNDRWEIIVWGVDLTKEVFDEALCVLEGRGGALKGKREPERESAPGDDGREKKGEAQYSHTEKKGPITYEVYRAPSKSIALEFLKSKPVSRQLYYLIVETPDEGNWGRDINGIFQE